MTRPAVPKVIAGSIEAIFWSISRRTRSAFRASVLPWFSSRNLSSPYSVRMRRLKPGSNPFKSTVPWKIKSAWF